MYKLVPLIFHELHLVRADASYYFVHLSDVSSSGNVKVLQLLKKMISNSAFFILIETLSNLRRSLGTIYPSAYFNGELTHSTSLI